MAALVPDVLVRRVGRARGVVEVGVGRDFGLALALQGGAPGVGFVVTDVDVRVLGAPWPLRPLVHDITRDGVVGLEGADLVLAVRLPEELQVACARVARELGADLALRPLKDEWADVAPWFLRYVGWPGGWRYFPHPSREQPEL